MSMNEFDPTSDSLFLNAAESLTLPDMHFLEFSMPSPVIVFAAYTVDVILYASIFYF